MWWDWSQITLVDSIVFSLVSILILYFVGSGFFRLIVYFRKSDPFNSFDFFQKSNFRILFGFIFIFVIVLFSSIFGIPFLASTVIVITVAIIGFILAFKKFEIKLPAKPRLQNSALFIVALVILLATVFVSSMLITGYYGSTNDDGADHTLMVRAILDNPHVLLTGNARPYFNPTLSYPLASHTLGAFFVTLLDVPIQKIIIMMSVILPCLIALAFYCTLKCLFENKVLATLGLMIVGFFGFGLFLTPISWGGLPLLLSLYISISGMGLIFAFLLKKKITSFNALLIGFIFFIASQTYPIALLILSLWFLLILSVKLLPKLRNINALKVASFFNKKRIAITVAFLIPLLFSIPYFSTVYTHSIAFVQLNKVDPASNIAAEAMKARIDFNWLLDLPALSSFFSAFGSLFALAPYSLILLIVLFIPQVSKRVASIFPVKQFRSGLLLLYIFLLLIMSYLTLSLYLPINFLSDFFNPERVWHHSFIIVITLVTVVIFSALYFSLLAIKRLLQSDKANVMKLSKNKVLAGALLALLVFSVGLPILPLVSEQQWQYNYAVVSLDTYETLGSDGLSLMKWIRENLTSDGNFLVSAADSGQFFAAVTQKHTISQYSNSGNYSDLMTLLTSNSSDLRAVPLMIKSNVYYVYVGSTPTTYALEYSFYRHFNATQLLLTPYFTVTKQIGNAWLFEFNSSAALDAYKNYTGLDV